MSKFLEYAEIETIVLLDDTFPDCDYYVPKFPTYNFFSKKQMEHVQFVVKEEVA